MRKLTRFKLAILAQLIVTGLPFAAPAADFKVESHTAKKTTEESSVDSIDLSQPAQNSNDEQKTLQIYRLQNNQWKEIKGLQIQNYLQGGQDLGGGNSYEAEFKSMGALVLQNLKGLTISPDGVNIERLEKVINQVKIIATDDRLVLNGTERHAINSRSKNVIVLSSRKWKQLNVSQKKILALHEYLRFCDVDDSNYSLSSSLAAVQQITLIPVGVGNIFHQIDLPKNVWELEDGPTVVGAKMDREPTDKVRVNFDGGLPILMVLYPDPILTSKYVYYGARWEENLYEDSEKPKASACLAKLNKKKSITHFVVGERNMNIMDCW